MALRIENTKLKEEVHDLRIKAKELEILKETTAKLLKADSEASETAAPKVLTFDEWNAMQKAATKAATPLPSPAKGLFSQFFGKEDEEPQALPSFDRRWCWSPSRPAQINSPKQPKWS